MGKAGVDARLVGGRLCEWSCLLGSVSPVGLVGLWLLGVIGVVSALTQAVLRRLISVAGVGAWGWMGERYQRCVLRGGVVCRGGVLVSTVKIGWEPLDVG